MASNATVFAEKMLSATKGYVTRIALTLSARIDDVEKRIAELPTKGLSPQLAVKEPADMAERITTLEQRITVLESRKSIAYRGIWLASSEYGQNDLCTYSGTLWICRAQGTRKKPGDGDAWQLCSKGDLKL